MTVYIYPKAVRAPPVPAGKCILSLFIHYLSEQGTVASTDADLDERAGALASARIPHHVAQRGYRRERGNTVNSDSIHLPEGRAGALGPGR